MSFFGSLGSFFKKIGKAVGEAFLTAGGRGLTDEVLSIALTWARVAANKAMDNAAKREFVVEILVARGIPESIARLAVELAVQVLKKELAAIPTPKP